MIFWRIHFVPYVPLAEDYSNIGFPPAQSTGCNELALVTFMILGTCYFQNQKISCKT